MKKLLILLSIALFVPFFKVNSTNGEASSPGFQRTSLAFEARSQHYFLPAVQQLKNALLDEQFRADLNQFIDSSLKQKDIKKETKDFLTVLSKGLKLNWKAIQAQENQMVGPLSPDLQKKLDKINAEQQKLQQNSELKKLSELAAPETVKSLISEGKNQISINVLELQKVFNQINKAHEESILLSNEVQAENEKRVANATDLKALEAWEVEFADAINNFIGGH